MSCAPPQGALFADLPPAGRDEGGEQFLTLFAAPGVRIERIVSQRHASPAGFWYDQAHAEWVMLAQGEAVLAFDDGRELRLRAGDWLTIPAHCRHRVAETGPDTVWLAVHVGEHPEPGAAPAATDDPAP